MIGMTDLEKSEGRFKEAMKTNENFIDQLKDIISKNYAIGDLINYEQIHLGSVNKSFIIKTAAKGKKEKYFLRKYKFGKNEDEIEFEHSIIKHLKKKRFDLVAGLIHTRDRKTFVNQYNDRNYFYAVFEILTGEDRYSWVNPDCSKKDLKNAAFVLARFHNMIFDLEPDQKRCEPKIIDFLPVIAQNISSYAEKIRKTQFNICLRENLKTILSTIEQTLYAFDFGIQGCEYKDLAHMVIHCDFHPGNLKFQNNAITGLFDFDWSKVDARCFDVALAIIYFCTVWKGKAGSRLHMAKTAVFFHAYQKASATGIGPLSDKELKYLPYMIKASNIYVMNWVIQDYYDRKNEIDPCINIRYLQHYIRFLQWFEKNSNFNELEKLMG